MTKLFNDKDFWKTAIKLAMPVALQNMLTSSFTLVDTLLVSRLGDVTLASVGMCGQWGWLMNMFIFGVCSATAVFVSQYWGVKDKAKIRITMGISLTVALIVSLLFFVLSFSFPHTVLGLFNRGEAADSPIITTGSYYLVIIAFSYPAVAITNVLSVVLRSTEKVRLPMYVSAVTTVTNIILDYCMIFGKFDFPEMGVRGAALATVISLWLGVAVLVIISAATKNILITNIKNVFGYTLNDVKIYARKAVSVILNETLWGAGVFVYNLIFSNMGYEYYAAITIQRSFENISYVFFIGFCSACAVMVGKAIGKGNIEEGIQNSRRFLTIIPVSAIFIGAIAIIFRSQLVGLFDMGNNISELTISSAKAIIVIYSVMMPIRSLEYVFIVGVLRSGGNTYSAMKIDLASLWLFSIPATLIAAYVIKAPFVVCFIVMYVFEDFIKVLLCNHHYRSLKWIKPVTEEGRKGLEEYLNG